MNQITVIETFENDPKEEDGVYRLRILQHWYYPEGRFYNGTLYPVVIPSSDEIIHKEMMKLYTFSLGYQHTIFMLQTDVLVSLRKYHTFMFCSPFQFLTKFKKPFVLPYEIQFMKKYGSQNTRVPFRFHTTLSISRNPSEGCFSLFGLLRSWGLAKSKPRWVQTVGKSRLIVANEFAITFSKKKRLYFFTTCFRYERCPQTNDLFHESTIIRDVAISRNCGHPINVPVFIPTKTWCHGLPNMEHILMLWQFGVFCDEFTTLNYLYKLLPRELWTLILDYLIGKIQDMLESDIIGPFDNFNLVKNYIQRFE